VLAFAILVILAAGVRLLTFERYLPYFDYSDETVPFLVARQMRGVFEDEFVRWRYAGYPPAYPLINAGVQVLVERFSVHPWTVPPDYWFALRLLAVWTGVITVLVIASIGGQLAGPIAAWFAGFIWALAPAITEVNSLATPDPFVYLTCALAITTALRAWRVESPRWLTFSLAMGILAIYLKLWPIHALIPWGIVTLVLLRRQPTKLLPWLVAWAIVGISAAAFLFVRIRPLDDLPAREIETFNSEGLTLIFDPSRNLANWSFAIYAIGLGLFLIMIVCGFLAYLVSQRRGWQTLNWRQIALLLVYSFGGIMMASSFTQARLEAGKIRHVLPVTVALLPLWGAGLAQILWTMKAWVPDRRFAPTRQLISPVGLFGLILIMIVPTFVSGHAELVRRFSQTDMQAILWYWADVNLPLEGRILMHPSSDVGHTWDRFWSGYDGEKPFEWWFELEDEIAASTPEEYVRRGITYFVMNETDRTRIFNTPELQAFVGQLTRIKILPATPEIRGDTVYIYRMLPPNVAPRIPFGDQITLAGYDINADAFAPGESIVFRPYWRAERRPETNYSMFIHLYPTDAEHIIAQFDGSPASLRRPTLTWDDTEELYIGSDATLTLPPDLQPGSYRLAIGLYDFNTGQRLTVEDTTYFTIPIVINPVVINPA
jgi:hypothetical protein